MSDARCVSRAGVREIRENPQRRSVALLPTNVRHTSRYERKDGVLKRALVSAAITAAAVSLTATPAFASTKPHSKTYLVRPGDSFWKISQRYGVTMQNLADYNDMSLYNYLDAGVTLRIPSKHWQASVSSAYEAPAAPAATTYTPTYTPASTPTYAAAPATSSYSPSGVWSCIAQHESGGNPATDTGNGYYGMYQFTLGSWQSAGGSGNPADASAAEQTAVAQRLQSMQGWGAWPVSSAACGA